MCSLATLNTVFADSVSLQLILCNYIKTHNFRI